MTVAAACALTGAAFAGCAKTSGSEASSAGTAAPLAAGAGNPVRGQAVFAQNCAACHGAQGEGGVGPSLKDEKSRKNDAAAIAWIKDPKPPMPKLYPSPLGEKDVADAAAYVESL